jgi:hypothetical protein
VKERGVVKANCEQYFSPRACPAHQKKKLKPIKTSQLVPPCTCAPPYRSRPRSPALIHTITPHMPPSTRAASVATGSGLSKPQSGGQPSKHNKPKKKVVASSLPPLPPPPAKKKATGGGGGGGRRPGAHGPGPAAGGAAVEEGGAEEEDTQPPPKTSARSSLRAFPAKTDQNGGRGGGPPPAPPSSTGGDTDDTEDGDAPVGEDPAQRKARRCVV